MSQLSTGFGQLVERVTLFSEKSFPTVSRLARVNRTAPVVRHDRGLRMSRSAAAMSTCGSLGSFGHREPVVSHWSIFFFNFTSRCSRSSRTLGSSGLHPPGNGHHSRLQQLPQSLPRLVICSESTRLCHVPESTNTRALSRPNRYHRRLCRAVVAAGALTRCPSCIVP